MNKYNHNAHFVTIQNNKKKKLAVCKQCTVCLYVYVYSSIKFYIKVKAI